VIELRVNFHRQLEAIETKIIHLFALVAEDLEAATQALLGGNDVLELVIDREQTIDAVYAEIEGLVNQQLARQSPVARDLRFLLSVLRVLPELERSHDLVVHLARHANHVLNADLSPRCRGLIQQMGHVGAEMWRRSADSWYQRDATAAGMLEERDDELDYLHATLIAELSSGQMSLPVAMDMTLVARFYERLGDHAVNIARRVVFLSGLSVPHSPQ
jgi:phosphate transport system protein